MIGNLRLAAGVLVTLWPAHALAQDFSDRELLAVIGVFEARKCVLDFEEAPTLIQAAGIDPAQMGAVVAWLLEGEHASVQNDGKQLLLGPKMCTP
jgi:hypothetical protein